MQLFCLLKRFLGCSSLLKLYKGRPVASGGAPGDNLVSLWGAFACLLFYKRYEKSFTCLRQTGERSS